MRRYRKKKRIRLGKRVAAGLLTAGFFILGIVFFIAFLHTGKGVIPPQDAFSDASFLAIPACFLAAWRLCRKRCLFLFTYGKKIFRLSNLRTTPLLTSDTPPPSTGGGARRTQNANPERACALSASDTRHHIKVPAELQQKIREYQSRRDLNLRDIAGYHRLVGQLKSDIDGYMQDRARAQQYIGRSGVKSYLFYGPGGTGKSHFARCFMGYLKRYGFISLDVKNWQQLAGSGWQQSMKMLMEFLDTVRDCRSQGLKVCITWDEFDGYIGGEMASDSKRIAAVKAAFDDWHAESAAPLIFFATTNEPQEFSEEMLRPGRLQPIFFPPPDSEARQAIIEQHLADRKLKEDEREVIIDWITRNTNYATVSELISYMDGVGSTVYARMRQKGQEEPISLADFRGRPVKINDYHVFLRKMKKKFNHKHQHKLAIFGEIERLIAGI